MIKIRKAKKKDISVISKIFIEESSKKPYNQRWNKKSAQEKIKNSLKNKDVYVAIIDKRVVGFSISIIFPNNLVKRAYLDELWISINYQNKGVGTKIMKLLEEKYRKKNVKKLDIITHRKAGALKFYKKMGYSESKDYVFIDKILK